MAKFKEATAKGEEMSKQATPVYGLHRRDIMKALWRKGTPTRPCARA